MWVFGYGSLMWDAWDDCPKYLRRVGATLPRYRREFNKASVENWGTRENPGPTLNLVADDASSCAGIAFEFSEEDRDKVLAYLKKREGKNFDLAERRIQLESADEATAFVPIYSGKNVLHGKTLSELAQMAWSAVGSRGRSIDYVQNIAAKLAAMRINDRHVDDFLKATEEVADKHTTDRTTAFGT